MASENNVWKAKSASRILQSLPGLSAKLDEAEKLLIKAQAGYQDLDRRVGQAVESGLESARLESGLQARLQELLSLLAPLHERMSALIMMAYLAWQRLPLARRREKGSGRPCQCVWDRHGRRITCWACQLAGEEE